MDIFGIIVFLFITISSIWALKTRKVYPTWVLIIFLAIGVVGLLVDSIIVYLTFLK